MKIRENSRTDTCLTSWLSTLTLHVEQVESGLDLVKFICGKGEINNDFIHGLKNVLQKSFQEVIRGKIKICAR